MVGKIFISKLTVLFVPTDISLSATSFNENIPQLSTIALLSTNDQMIRISYQLISEMEMKTCTICCYK